MPKTAGRPRRQEARAVTTKKRNRRSPVEILSELKEQRDALAKRMEEKLTKLDERIARVEARYDKQIRLAELTENLSLEDIAKKLEETKRQQKLLRMAMKAKG